MRYKMDFSYSGYEFCGYQKQPNLRCIQSEIENVLTMINNSKEVKLVSSGRTDRFVNALHQIAHFDLDIDLSSYKLKGALNSYLKDDIYINDVVKVDKSFHARYNVLNKTYKYYINTGIYNPLKRNYIYQYCKKLNVNLMKENIIKFIGIHDFTSFTSADSLSNNKIRTIYEAYIEEKDDLIIITFKADGFLKYQVRNMVGLLIKIGENKKYDIGKILESKDRKKASITAPACGLTLYNVEY